MKISRVTIKNYMGIEDCEFRPSSLTVISGRNGSGKTSIAEALKSVVGSGHDPSVVRIGAEAAAVEIETDDGTTIKLRTTDKRTTRDVTDEKGRKITKSAEYIRSIVNSLTLDPISFLSAAPKDQVKALLSAIPLRVTAQDLSFVPVKALEGISLDGHALEVLGDKSHGITGNIYQERAELNRVAKEKRATANQLKGTLPDQPAEGDWGGALQAATDEYVNLRNTARARLRAIDRDAATAAESVREIFRLQDKEVMEEAAVAIQKIRDDSAIEIARCLSERDHKLAAIELDKNGATKAAGDDYQPKYKALTEQIAQAKAMVEAETKARTTREFIAGEEGKARQMESESEKLTAALTKLEALKAKLASELPVPGLEITDDGLTLDGVSFRRVNKAKQIQVALSVAKLQAGEMGLIVIDDMEHLDSAAFEAFRAAAEASGLQFIAARVADGELAVTA